MGTFKQKNLECMCVERDPTWKAQNKGIVEF